MSTVYSMLRSQEILLPPNKELSLKLGGKPFPLAKLKFEEDEDLVVIRATNYQNNVTEVHVMHRSQVNLTAEVVHLPIPRQPATSPS